MERKGGEEGREGRREGGREGEKGEGGRERKGLGKRRGGEKEEKEAGGEWTRSSVNCLSLFSFCSDYYSSLSVCPTSVTITRWTLLISLW